MDTEHLKYGDYNFCPACGKICGKEVFCNKDCEHIHNTNMKEYWEKNIPNQTEQMGWRSTGEGTKRNCFCIGADKCKDRTCHLVQDRLRREWQHNPVESIDNRTVDELEKIMRGVKAITYQYCLPNECLRIIVQYILDREKGVKYKYINDAIERQIILANMQNDINKYGEFQCDWNEALRDLSEHFGRGGEGYPKRSGGEGVQK